MDEIVNELDGSSLSPVPQVINLAPITAPATAVAVPALRRHAAVDPHPVAVVVPTLLSAETDPFAMRLASTRRSARIFRGRPAQLDSQR
jgi:hypothetical protein